MSRRYDLVVVGGGTAGLVSAYGAASLGARVALVERDALGGECLHYGCVPTKALVKSARVAHLVRNSEDYGVKSGGETEVDFPAVIERMRKAIRTAGEADTPERFREAGVEVYPEQARFEAPDVVSVGGRRLKTRSAIIATGSHATTPPVDGLEEVGYITHVGALELERLPRSVVIIGAGPIGTEFAQILARFGSEVTVVSSSPLPLPQEDPEISGELKRILTSEGVTFHGGFRAEEARAENGEKVLTAVDEYGGRVEARGEEILVAAGRAPTVNGLGLENAGVELQPRGLAVDSRLRTTAENVYAAGDITGKYLFTHVAEYQAKTAVRNALFPIKGRADYRAVPWTTFTDPEVARVGLTEGQARQRYRRVRVFRQPFAEVDRAVTDGERAGLVKLVADGRGRVLGGHIVGPEAGNLIQEVVLAMHENASVQDLSATIHVYPTLVQANQRAAEDYYRQRLFTDRNRKALSAFFATRRRLGERRERKGR